MNCALVVTCEHAGNRVPFEYQQLFNELGEMLNSHEGWDPGAWEVARQVADAIQAPLFGCHTTRLLIETNRSKNSPQLFSKAVEGLTVTQKEYLISTIYKPYRSEVEAHIRTVLKPVLHFSIHSFTPVWNGEERKTDIGILFDPSRSLEISVAQHLRQYLLRALSDFNIDFNEPYLGIDDGFTTALRKEFPDDHYSGVEIEVNQKYVSNLTKIIHALASALRQFS